MQPKFLLKRSNIIVLFVIIKIRGWSDSRSVGEWLLLNWGVEDSPPCGGSYRVSSYMFLLAISNRLRWRKKSWYDLSEKVVGKRVQSQAHYGPTLPLLSPSPLPLSSVWGDLNEMDERIHIKKCSIKIYIKINNPRSQFCFNNKQSAKNC